MGLVNELADLSRSEYWNDNDHLEMRTIPFKGGRI